MAKLNTNFCAELARNQIKIGYLHGPKKMLFVYPYREDLDVNLLK